MHARQQGDQGELSAMEWLGAQGRPIYIPVGHAPDCDLVTEVEGQLVGVQVKTTTFMRAGRFEVALSTNGGNRSWTGLVKRFSGSRCDWLFVLAGDGRRWFIPAHAVGGSRKLVLGGPKYASFEIERGRRLQATVADRSLDSQRPWRGSRAVKGDGL
ncbi:MAG: group I intron-associated PD-(D/E)XK endonuclease [Solirubrobacteraceae bacterium]